MTQHSTVRPRNFGRDLDDLLDQRPLDTRETPGEAAAAAGLPTITNDNSDLNVSAGLVYGTGSGGKLALAIGADLGFVEPKAVSIGSASFGKSFPVSNAGRTPVFVEPGTTPSAGDRAWLSVSKAGRVTDIEPVTGTRFALGSFVDGILDDFGRSDIALQMSDQGSGTI